MAPPGSAPSERPRNMTPKVKTLPRAAGWFTRKALMRHRLKEAGSVFG
jgi:hypothetical protein